MARKIPRIDVDMIAGRVTLKSRFASSVQLVCANPKATPEMTTWRMGGKASRHEHIHDPTSKKDFFDNAADHCRENPQEFKQRDFFLFS